MRKLIKKFNIKKLYQISSILIFIIGLFFTYLIAELNDAPGFIIFGSAINIGCSLLIYGLGTLIELSKENNKILEDIYKNINKGE